jgi:hypothetical protein
MKTQKQAVLIFVMLLVAFSMVSLVAAQEETAVPDETEEAPQPHRCSTRALPPQYPGAQVDRYKQPAHHCSELAGPTPSPEVSATSLNRDSMRIHLRC